ncbi:glycosyltransferase [Nocardioides houyundeii]|uniref:glycosyltransferase n=1 Tax=Nocardioides houyundeii TaxID=2045452 RepID=UPI000C769BEB|nr:glycosyltransferase [Nocardioides houyundeii]
MIGYYVHHHGDGHRHRMESVAARLAEPVTVLSSLAPPAGSRRPWVVLDRDDEGPAADADVDADVDAGGRLHWVPRHDRGLAARAAQLTRWITEARPSALVVDVSVEVGLLARLCGVPVVTVVMPGRRTDPAHSLLHDIAEVLLAPWPEDLPEDLAEELTSGWPERWRSKTVFTGAISRFDGRVATGPPAERSAGTAFLLWGAGGSADRQSAFASAERATPGWQWSSARPGRRLDAEQVWGGLREAAVVVTHAGQNAVAEVAAARAPAVVVADPRPFDEQHHTLRRLSRLGLAVTAPAWPEPHEWPDLLARAAAADGSAWSAWNDGRGADRAAAAIARVAGGPRT